MVVRTRGGSQMIRPACDCNLPQNILTSVSNTLIKQLSEINEQRLREICVHLLRITCTGVRQLLEIEQRAVFGFGVLTRHAKSIKALGMLKT